jgi:hypothetical protein
MGTDDRSIKRVRLSGINVRFRGGLTLTDVENQRGTNPFFFSSKRKASTEYNDERAGYPEPSAHGIQPAWGLSISHAEHVFLKNIRLETIKHDERRAIFMHNTRRVRTRNVITINKGL